MRALKRLIPAPLLGLYHFSLQLVAALICGFPARKLVVIGVTGTKGKTTVSEMLYRVLTDAGYKTSLASTVHFVTPLGEVPNRHKMTMPGRGFIQYFLKRALQAGSTHVVVEISSEAARQYRHRFLDLDALVVTNIHPEHIESHGSFERYVGAKREIVRELERSTKRNRVLVSNTDIAETKAFLDAAVPTKLGFSVSEIDSAPHTPLPGEMSRMNTLAVLKVLTALGVGDDTVRDSLSKLSHIRGRLERVESGQDFTVIVDYAHTVESLRALYSSFPGRKICILGNTGGGRDQWKRPLMGAVADELCETVILTNEDPYDEDPRAIVDAMAKDMKRTPQIILDRRTAFSTAFGLAHTGDTVIISGKGTDPYIMGPRGQKTPWDDATVAREELAKRGNKS